MSTRKVIERIFMCVYACIRMRVFVCSFIIFVKTHLAGKWNEILNERCHNLGNSSSFYKPFFFFFFLRKWIIWTSHAKWILLVYSSKNRIGKMRQHKFYLINTKINHDKLMCLCDQKKFFFLVHIRCTDDYRVKNGKYL